MADVNGFGQGVPNADLRSVGRRELQVSHLPRRDPVQFRSIEVGVDRDMDPMEIYCAVVVLD